MKGALLIGAMPKADLGDMAAPEPPAEGPANVTTLKSEADMAAKAFAQNPSADTFAAARDLCAEYEAAKGPDAYESEV